MISNTNISPAEIGIRQDGSLVLTGAAHDFLAAHVDLASVKGKVIAAGSNSGCENTACNPSLPNQVCVNVGCHIIEPGGPGG